MLKEDILKLIERNSKLTPAELAVMIGATQDEVAAAISELEGNGTICGYPTLINWDNTDNELVTALIEVKVTPQRGQGFDKIAERIYKFDEVKALYLMSGGFDFTVIIEGRTMREVANFVSSKLAPMEAVLSTATHFVMVKYKDHGMTLINEIKDERMLITP